MICPYQQLSDCRGKIFVGLGVLLVLALAQFLRLEFDNSSAVFIPDSGKNFQIAAKILAKAPAAGMLYVGIAGDGAKEAAKKIKDAVPPELATAVVTDFSDITPATVVRAFPYFFSPSMEKKLRHRIDEQLPDLMVQNRHAIQGFGAIAGVGWVRGDPLGLRNLLREEIPLNLIDMDAARNDDAHYLLMFRPTSSSFDSESSRRLIKTIRAEATPSCALYISGAPVHAAANGEAVGRDLIRIVLLSFLGFSLAYAFLARSWGAIWILGIAGVSTVFAVAVVGVAWPAASGLAIGFGASLMGLAEDYAVHMHFGLRSGNDQDDIYCSLFPPLTQAFLLNVSGFCVLLFSSVPIIRQMALFACTSLSIGFLLAIIAAPFLPGFTKPRNIPCEIKGERHAPSLVRGLILLCAILAGCILLCPQINFNFSPRLLGAKAREIASDTEKIKELWKVGTGTRFIVEGTTADDALVKARHLAEMLRCAGARGVLSPSDFLTGATQEHDNVQRWQAWLDTQDLKQRLENAAEHVGFTPGAFTPFYNALAKPPQKLSIPSDFLLFDTTAIVLCSDVPTGIDLEEGVYPFSLPQLEQEIAESFKNSQRVLGYATISICLLLCLLIRTPGRVVAVLVPPLFSILMVFLVFTICRMPFSMAAACAIPIIFGLSLDHGIMITHTFIEGQALGARKAIILASITAFFSIGLLALSDHPALRTMGTAIFAGLAGELAAALWLVPLIYPLKK